MTTRDDGSVDMARVRELVGDADDAVDELMDILGVPDEDEPDSDDAGRSVARSASPATRTKPEAHMSEPKSKTPPRENLVRGIWPVKLRDSGDSGMPVLAGHFAVFNQWTEIDSIWEGNFLESVAPGAFARTFKNNRASMRALFQHGQDPVIGDKPLGPIDVLEEDDTGARYEVPLLDTSYNADLLPGLRAGLYGASFRFRVVQEDMNKKPQRSDHNPDGLPERTIREAQVMEFGPVTFPAYEGATAGVRSLTDDFIRAELIGDPGLIRQLFSQYTPHQHAGAALSPGPGIPTPSQTRRTAPVAVQTTKFHTREEWLEWISSI